MEFECNITVYVIEIEQYQLKSLNGSNLQIYSIFCEFNENLTILTNGKYLHRII